MAFFALNGPAWATDVAASPPQALSVTIYRNPVRGTGSIKLEQLGGFALVTETRTVHLPAGESRLRFEGVVDGIQPESAIVTGLPNGVIEKNRDAALLSPEALVRAAVNAEVALVRVNKKTGKVSRQSAVVRSANADGVTFETEDGIEALKCSGADETFQYSRLPSGLSAKPVLSVLTRTNRPVNARVTLSYLANGFDWGANYVARLNPDGQTLNLAGWITLANANTVSLPRTSLQIVAGRLHRLNGRTLFLNGAPRVIARCWPTGTTSDTPTRPQVQMVSPDGVLDEIIVTARRRGLAPPPLPIPMAPAPANLPPPPPPPEALGDLKLYRVPLPTTIAANQSKQVRLLEQADIPFTRMLSADLAATGASSAQPATAFLRTKNTLSDKLGLPLPAGSVAVFEVGSGSSLLIGEAPLRDTAIDEDVELRVGVNPAVQVQQTRLSLTATPPELINLTPDLMIAIQHGETVEEVSIINALSEPTPFELRLRAYGTLHVVSADHAMEMKDGRPIFRLGLPANSVTKVRYSVVR